MPHMKQILEDFKHQLRHIILDFSMVEKHSYLNFDLKGELYDSFTNYKYVGNTKVSVSIKNTSANKCTLSDIFLTEI